MNYDEAQKRIAELEAELPTTAKLRKEFDDFKEQLATQVDASRQIIDAYLRQCQKARKMEVARLERDKEFCERVVEQDRVVLEKTFAEQSQGFPTLAKAFSDYLALRDKQMEDFLRGKAWLNLSTEDKGRSLVWKGRPAPQTADIVHDTNAERRRLAQRCRELEYQLLYYEELFPQLAEYREIGSADEPPVKQEDSDEDPAKTFLSDEEYGQLPTAQKFQLALDRYWTRRKTPWTLGRDYERYIGYLYETRGYEVYYQGIIEGYEDRGRDLVCRKAGESVIVQCKYWAQDKVIREKHITQLFGTCVEFWIAQQGQSGRMENLPAVLGTKQLVPCFTTSTVLSETARQFAAALRVEVLEQFPLKPYPCIKCNVSRQTGEKIYHLPFDQQYDHTFVEKDRGECYVQTIVEAETKGFRRAFRWGGDRIDPQEPSLPCAGGIHG